MTLKNVPCIYAARCVPTGKRYIGSARKGLSRCKTHASALRRKIHRNKYLQNAWNKHGEDSFVWELVELCSVGKLRIREQFWIDHFKTASPRFGFNIAYPVRQRLPSKRMSKRHRQYWAALTEEEYQARIACYKDENYTKLVRGIRNAPAYVKNISEKASERWAREEFKTKMDAIFEAFWSDPEKRAEASQVRSVNATKDWDGNAERRQATSDAKTELWKKPEYREERSQGTIELWQKPEYREDVTNKIKISCNNPEYLEALRERVRQQWAKRKAEGKTGRLGQD